MLDALKDMALMNDTSHSRVLRLFVQPQYSDWFTSTTVCGQWAPASHTRTHARTPTNAPAQPHQPARRIRQHTHTHTRLYKGSSAKGRR